MPAADLWYTDAPVDGPARRAAAVTKDDSTQLTVASRALYVGTAGNLKVTMISGDVVTFPNVPAGALLPIQVKLVWDTGSTAADIVSIW